MPGRGPQALAVEWEKRISELVSLSPGNQEFWTQSLIAERLGVSVATVNRAIRRARLGIPAGRTLRTTRANIGQVIAGLYLDPPVRVLALLADSAEQRHHSRLGGAIGKLARQIGELERELANVQLCDGRVATLKRFLRDIAVLAAGRRVEVVSNSLSPPMIEEIARLQFTRRNCAASATGRSWLWAGMSNLNCDCKLGQECGELGRRIERLMLRHRRLLHYSGRLRRLRRPWFLLCKWTPPRAA
jgi:DNA-binding Lrp family transcriptional regulator